MTASLASAITKAASQQTFYTIRYLVDRQRVADAYRAYAYFRWVDDVLDEAAPSGSAPLDAERSERWRFLDRQKSLLNRCLRGEPPRDPTPHETMLVELLAHADEASAGLESYLRELTARGSVRILVELTGLRVKAAGRLLEQVASRCQFSARIHGPDSEWTRNGRGDRVRRAAGAIRRGPTHARAERGAGGET